MKKDHLTEFEPSEKALATLLHRRSMRRHQRTSRGGKTSHRDNYENAAILLAWESGEITEGQAARALRLDRVSARELKLKSTALGRAIAFSL